jgi:hypothetical protein
MNNSDMPAMPCSVSEKVEGSMGLITNYITCHGLTKREYFAAMAMQGAISNPNFNGDITLAARDAVAAADALLKELEK